jgi:hypothetical protein
MSNKIAIANPIGSRYTSRKRADDFVRRGEAEFLADGSLRFLTLNQSKRIFDQHGREASERQIQGDRKIFVWSGERKGDRFSEADCRPGIFRS